ncbi:AGE family epimerase/isomerase [Hyphomonadaceae bacterium ML37]|nr:AGE family epimerase/isomerase [Hyphomonadaceae bacterium ML37]
MTTMRPFILCGGSGTRLWPVSTPERPKQFHALSGARSMIAETAARLPARLGAITLAPASAVAGARWREALAAHLPGGAMVLEPIARNSGPAVAAAALCADGDDLVLILPADHHIADVPAFHEALARGAEAAADGALVTFGIRPDHAATGYGYIELASPEAAQARFAPAQAFVEKPGREVAESYLAGGRHLWNAGIFLFRAGAMIAALERHAPDILTAVRAALPAAGPMAPDEARTLMREAFAAAPSISIDYAVMEKAERVHVVPVSMGWSDLGDFRALKALHGAGRDSVLIGPAAEDQGSDNFIFSTGPRVAVRGLSGIAVAASPDGVLVTALDQAAEIRGAVEAASRRYAPNLNPALADRARAWVYDRMLPAWAASGWDPVHGGFVETLTRKGAPNLAQPRRGRVAPRQVFAFATALMHGWDKDGAASRLVDQGLDFLDGRARAPDGGWAHVLDGSGAVTDARRDLYDHAFVALGAARAFQATGDERAERMAREAFAVIDATQRNGGPGWASPETTPGLKQSNPHMHMLEASLVWFEASGDPDARARIETLAWLFEAYLFDPMSGAVGEDYHPDWTPVGDAASARIEPGHCYEWAWLLSEAQRLTGRDTASWSRRLIQFADTHGRGRDGFSLDAVTADGAPIAATCRAWPQLERIRARLRFPETAAPGEAQRELAVFMDAYIDETSLAWCDRRQTDGCAPMDYLPASMPYHFMTALGGL